MHTIPGPRDDGHSTDWRAATPTAAPLGTCFPAAGGLASSRKTCPSQDHPEGHWSARGSSTPTVLNSPRWNYSHGPGPHKGESGEQACIGHSTPASPHSRTLQVQREHRPLQTALDGAKSKGSDMAAKLSPRHGGLACSLSPSS